MNSPRPGRRKNPNDLGLQYQDGLFTGCFVGTAMNHRAAYYTEIAGQPITAAVGLSCTPLHICWCVQIGIWNFCAWVDC